MELNFHRYMGGFATNESGTIYLDSFVRSKAKFTKQDEENPPALPSVYDTVKSAFENGDIKPPHIKQADKMKNTVNGIIGWYAKTDEGIIGIVRITWCYVYNDCDLCFDDSYYIIEYDSETCKSIDRDKLLEKFGECETTYIYDGEYDNLGKVYDRDNIILE